MTRLKQVLGCVCWLCCCGAIGLSCGSLGGRRVEVQREISSRNSGGPNLNYRPSPLFANPIYITDNQMWLDVQQTLGRKLEDVDFSKHSVVGCFAQEPDVEKDAEGNFKDRGYGVWLTSITKDSDNNYTVRFKQKTAHALQSARGPLHYYFGVVEGQLKNPVYYINGEKYMLKSQPVFLRQEGMGKQLKDAYLGGKDQKP